MLQIITHPHQTLRTKAATIPVDEIPTHRTLVSDMKKTMLEADGIGLAAPQVNISKQLTVINTKDGILALFNPVIRKKSFRKDEAEEGCLSIPGVFGLVKRHMNITIDAYTDDGKAVTINADGLFARVLQHEIDHLNGVLFIDRTKKITSSDGNAATSA